MTKNQRIKILIILPIILLAVFYFGKSANAAVIFSENYDGITSRFDCSGGLSIVPTTAQGAQIDWSQWHEYESCYSYTYNGVTHYSGEITTRGRNGSKGLTIWRRNWLQGLKFKYVGAETSATIGSTGYFDYHLQLYAPAGNLVEAIDLANPSYDTLGELCTYINNKADWECMLNPEVPSTDPSNTLRATYVTYTYTPVSVMADTWIGLSGNTGYAGGMYKILTESEFNNHYRDLYVREYIKFPTDWDATLAGGETHKLSRYYISQTYGAGHKELLWNVQGFTFKTGSFSLSNPLYMVLYSDSLSDLGVLDGNWHCYEIRLKMNTTGTADGIIQFWIDGVEQYLTWPYHTPERTLGRVNEYFGYETDDYFYNLLVPEIGNLGTGDWNFPTDNWYAIDFDNYVVSTSYIGPDKQVSDTTPPAAPSGVTVN